MSTQQNAHTALDAYPEKLQAIAGRVPHHGPALVQLASLLAEAGATEWPTGPGTVEEGLAYILMNAADVACTIAETPAPIRLPRPIRELLVGLIELSSDPDHGTWDAGQVTALRDKAREILLDG